MLQLSEIIGDLRTYKGSNFLFKNRSISHGSFWSVLGVFIPRSTKSEMKSGVRLAAKTSECCGGLFYFELLASQILLGCNLQLRRLQKLALASCFPGRLRDWLQGLDSHIYRTARTSFVITYSHLTHQKSFSPSFSLSCNSSLFSKSYSVFLWYTHGKQQKVNSTSYFSLQYPLLT
jgi:hypothetical protein